MPGTAATTCDRRGHPFAHDCRPTGSLESVCMPCGETVPGYWRQTYLQRLAHLEDAYGQESVREPPRISCHDAQGKIL